MLESIAIQNFRSCVSTVLEPRGSFCALAGRNGAGKTNLFYAIMAIAGTSKSRDILELFELDPSQGPPHKSAVDVIFRLDREKYTYSVAIDYVTTPLPPQGPDQKRLTLEESLRVEDDAGEEILLFRRQGENVYLPRSNARLQISRYLPTLAALNSIRPEDDQLSSHLQNIDQFLKSIDLYNLEESGKPSDFVDGQLYEDWKSRYESDGTTKNFVSVRLIYMYQEAPDKFEELKSILGPDGLNLIDDIQITSFPSSNDKAPKAANGRGSGLDRRYFPQFLPSSEMGHRNQPLRFSQLSAGTRRAIRLITSMIFDERSVMLIEQPEDSIHPGLLRKLIDVLQTYSSKAQIIISTHSSAVMNMVDPEDIQLVVAEDGQTTVHPLSTRDIERARAFIAEEGSLSEYLEIFKGV